MFGTSKRLRVCLGIWTPIRSAQVGYVRTAGSEAARFHVQIYLIAHNGVENPAYFPPEFTKTSNFKELLAQHVPLGHAGRRSPICTVSGLGSEQLLRRSRHSLFRRVGE